MNRIILIVLLSMVSFPLYATTVGIQESGFELGVGNFFSENLIVTSYFDGDELRATFSYRLDDASSFNSQSLSGWMHLDVAQSYNLNQDEHEIRVGFSDVDPSEPIALAFMAGFSG